MPPLHTAPVPLRSLDGKGDPQLIAQVRDLALAVHTLQAQVTQMAQLQGVAARLTQLEQRLSALSAQVQMMYTQPPATP